MDNAAPSLPRSAEELFDHLIALGRHVIAHDDAEVAYHVLAASLACAHSIGSAERLALVEQLANEWQGRLDAERPAEKLSTTQAHRRGMPAIFTTLARTAKSAAIGVANREAVDRAKERIEGNAP